MTTRITATELSRHLSDVLSRVRYRGESFEVERNGEAVATITPARPAPRGRWQDLVQVLERLSPVDAGFADDLERIQCEQPAAEFPAWPSS